MLNQNEAADAEGLKRQSFKQVQTNIDNIGGAAVLVWIKGYLCPVGQ